MTSSFPVSIREFFILDGDSERGFRRTYDLRRLATIQTTEEDEDPSPDFVLSAVFFVDGRSTTEFGFSLFHDRFGDPVRHLAMVDGFGRAHLDWLRRERLNGIVGIRRRLGLLRFDRFFAGVKNGIVADEQRGIPRHGG